MIETKAAAVVGTDNVVNEYLVDPTSTLPTEGAPLFVEDTILFGPGNAEIDPAFAPILDLGTLLMLQNPAVSIRVIGHTDSSGPEDSNVQLSRERAEAVVNYWLQSGIDEQRLTAIARGESEPLADNSTETGAATNRRAVFII